jgi:aryl-alcohol dehydrogenase-like predicted oxidoreductase
MRTRTLGATGISVSAIGLGGWQLGNVEAWHGPDREASLRIIEEALALGVTLFDTAPGYAGGRSELLLGEALEGRRDDVVLVTKFGHNADGQTDWDPDRIEAAIERSLLALRTDHLDAVLMHSPPAELLDGRTAAHYARFQELQDSGVVRAYGASVDRAADIDTVVATTGSRVLEVLLNAFHQEPLAALQKAAAQGVGAIVKVPLDSGWLTGRYDERASFTDIRSRWDAATIERRAALVARLRAIVPADVTLTHAALRWLLAQDCVSSVIPGAKSVEQLRVNVAAADDVLAPETVDAIRALWAAEIEGAALPW